MPRSNIESLIKTINSKSKTGDISFGVEFTEVDTIPFSSMRLNYTTHGGVPVGRLIEFSGADSSGKTTTALDLVHNAQLKYPDKRVLFCDIESTFDTDWAVKLGVDIDNLILYRPDAQDAEEVFQNLLDLMDTGEVSLCILDSIGAMVSGQENEKDIKDRTYGGISMSLTRFAKKAVPVCFRNKCTFVGINQVREDLNSQYGGLTTVGGKAWRHQCSMRLSFRHGSFIDEKGNQVSRAVENPSGNLCMFNLEKSKVCASDRKSGFYTIRYLTGIDFLGDTVDLAIKCDIVHQAGAWYSIVDTETGEILSDSGIELKFQGKPKLIEYLKDNKEMYDRIVELAQQRIE